MGINDAERARAVSYLRDTKALVLEQTGGLSEAQWRFRPGPTSWSACQCIAHISLVERRTLGIVQGFAESREATGEALSQNAGKDDLLIKMIRSRKVKVEAPLAMCPDLESPDPAWIIAQFSEIRDHSIEYLESTEDPLRSRTSPHPFLGPFDGYQWMLFLSAHAERHLRQIQENKEHPEYPR